MTEQMFYIHIEEPITFRYMEKESSPTTMLRGKLSSGERKRVLVQKTHDSADAGVHTHTHTETP